MKHITRDEALKLLVRNNPEPVASHCDKSMWWFITRAVGGLWIQHPLKMIVSWLYLLMLPLIYVQKSIGFAIIGIPFVFFCILAYYFYFYRKLYKALRENTYRIDEDGISVSITTVDGVLARYLTTPFSLIKDIWLAQNYIYIETEDKTDIGVVYLFSDEPERILGNIVSYMQLEKKAKEDKSLPYYSAEERTDLRNFVEERFGKIDAVLNDTDAQPRILQAIGQWRNNFRCNQIHRRLCGGTLRIRYVSAARLERNRCRFKQRQQLLVSPLVARCSAIHLL